MNVYSILITNKWDMARIELATKITKTAKNLQRFYENYYYYFLFFFKLYLFVLLCYI